MIEFDYYQIFCKEDDMAYQSDESIHPFWEHTSEYAARKEDTSFMGEVAYVLVTLYKSEIPQ